MSREPVVWMNVSTSASWNRPPVGIVRVERELCLSLKALYQNRLRTCVLRNGKFVPYNISSLETDDLSDGESGSEFIPDASFDFPNAMSLEPVGFVQTKRLEALNVDDRSTGNEMLYGDTLISVGLDWDWEKHRIDKIFYDLKTKRGVNIVTCCYDLIPVLFPQYCVGDVSKKFKNYFTNMAWASSLVLCISKTTERDYKAFSRSIGLPEKPTVIIPLGNNIPKAGNILGDDVRRIIGEKFILFVSTIERRKNHEVLYRAYHILRKRDRNADLPKLVFVGMPGWGVHDLLKDIELDPLTQGDIIQLHHVNDAELRTLYEKCEFFVYPSLYEGWGLPIAEALALGKPVVASASGSIPEVGGDLVKYVAPWNPEEWADAMSDFINDSSELASRALQIRDNFKPTSWQSTGKVVANAIYDLNRHQINKVDCYPGYELRTQVGIAYGNKIISTGEGGVLAFGPYISAPAGPLSATFYFSEMSGGSETLTIRLAFDKGNTVICEKVLTVKQLAGLNGVVEMDFSVVDDHIFDLEVVILVEENFIVTVDRIAFNFNTTRAVPMMPDV